MGNSYFHEGEAKIPRLNTHKDSCIFIKQFWLNYMVTSYTLVYFNDLLVILILEVS